MYLEHAFWADWNAGDWGSIPEPELIWIPPPGPGSGKFGTPWERMQSENLIPAASPCELEPVLDFPEDPHAVSSTAQLTAASATSRLRRRLAAPIRFTLRTAGDCAETVATVVVVAR